MARPRDPRVDRLVVDACVALLHERGRAGLSRAQIADRAGVSLPAVNRRFADVDEILLLVAQTPGRAADAARPAAAGSLRDYLRDGLAATSRAFADGGVRRAAAELIAAAAGNDDIDRAFQETLAQLRSGAAAWVEAEKTAGALRPDVDPDLLLDLVIGSAYYRLLWRGTAITLDEVDDVVDLVLRGSRPGR